MRARVLVVGVLALLLLGWWLWSRPAIRHSSFETTLPAVCTMPPQPCGNPPRVPRPLPVLSIFENPARINVTYTYDAKLRQCKEYRSIPGCKPTANSFKALWECSGALDMKCLPPGAFCDMEPYRISADKKACTGKYGDTLYYYDKASKSCKTWTTACKLRATANTFKTLDECQKASVKCVG